MELITPKCIGGKQCYSVCNAKGCSNKPFMCVDGCQCQQSHKLCFLSIKWKIIKQIFSKKLIKPSVQTKNYLSQVEEIYKSILKQVQISYNEMRNLQYTFGLNQVQKNIFTKVCSHQTSQLTGNLMSYIQLKYVPSQITIIDELIQERRKQINKQTEILLNMVSNLTTYKQTIEMDSKLISSIQLVSLFTKKIKKCNLLFRASENDFQVAKFHQKCDGKQHTITIIKTEFDKIIGGYTPLSWNKSKHNQYQTDSNMQSFIFSLTNKHKLTLIEGKQENAIGHHKSLGPVFGGGRDLFISDKANQNADSGARPGYTYNYDQEYTFGNYQSYNKFSGQSSGYKFKIQQWQVYQVVFE